MRLQSILFSPLIIGIILSSCTRNDDIAQFRGPNRDGIFPESGLLKAWPEDGPEEIFFADGIGDGYGSPVISGDNLYVTGTIDSTAVLFCFDLEGNKNWDLVLGPEWVESYPGSRSAPTVTGGLLYTATGFGDLYCINLKDSSIRWSKSLEDDFRGILPRFGHSEAPVVHRDKVYWTPGGKTHNVVALNRYTGDLAWSSEGMQERSAYHPPRIIETPSGRSVLLTFSAYHLMALDAETGALLWTHEQDNYPIEERKPGYGDTHGNTVIYENGNIYYAAGDGNCGVKLTMSDDGSRISEVWRNRLFDSFMGGIVKIDSQLFGSGTARPNLYAIDSKSGRMTDSLRIGRGVVVAADSMLYFYAQNGNVHLISSEEGYLTPVSSFRIRKGTREHFSHPLIEKGILYVRHGNVIMGFDIRAVTG